MVKYDIDDRNRLSLLGFYSREADDETRELGGIARSVSGVDPVYSTRLRYVMRSILTTRLGGKHEIPKARNLEVDWFGSYSQARRDDPAIREMLFTDAGSNGTYRIDRGNESGKQTFLDLTDHTESGALNFTLPFKQWGSLESRAKAGAWVEGKQRTFTVRRFMYQQDDVSMVPNGTGNVIHRNNIGGGDGSGAFFLQEGTRPEDNYEATQEIFAGYGMLELPFVRWFKIAGGTRFEASYIQVNPYDPFARNRDDAPAQSNGASLDDLRWLPSVSLIFSPTDKQNIRLVGSRTLARPEFRELAPFVFTDFVGGANVQGNPNLVTTNVWNADLRWEWFPSSSEVVALSGFYKRFERPIEQIRVQAGSTQISSFNNARAADLGGAEIEGRKTLEFISNKLRHLSIGANFAYMVSRVSLGPKCDVALDESCADGRGEVSTNRERALQDQSPFVVNAYLGYDNEDIGTHARVLYNVAGRRIAEVGGAGLPDIYQEPRHDLAVVFGQRLYKGLGLTLTVQNILNAPVYRTQSHKVVYRYHDGAEVTLSLGYRF
jgi:TonB-dependent receptor